MTITVKLPDGSTAQFPDGTAPDVMTQAIQAKFPPSAAAASSGSPPAASGVAVAQAPQAGPPSLLGSALATANHAVTDLPVVGAPIQWLGDNLAAQTIGRLSGQDPATWLKNAQAARSANDAANPVAAAAGGIGGNLAATVGLAGAPVGAEALGMSGKLLPSFAGGFKPGQMLASGLSTLGLGTINNMEKGQSPTTAMGNAVGPGAVASVIPAVGAAVSKGSQSVMDAINASRQNAATTAAIAGAPTAAALKAQGNSLFGSSVDTNPPAIAAPAYNRLMNGIQTALQKFRPNSANDPQTVGLLQHLSSLADAASTPGTVVDLKDIHLARQLAGQVGESPGRDGTMGKIVVSQIDNFVNSLKPSDILGATDPKQAASDLMKGISTWNRALKVQTIQDAINKAPAYQSGVVSGLKNQFSSIMKSDDFTRFSPQEQTAIAQVAKGTATQNTLDMLGKMGFSPGGGGAHNIIGGTIGAGLGTEALGHYLGLGQMVAGPLALGASMGASALGRAGAKKLALSGANRAAQIVATPNIPSVAPMQLPQLMQGAPQGLEALLRAALTSQMTATQ